VNVTKQTTHKNTEVLNKIVEYLTYSCVSSLYVSSPYVAYII